MTKKAINIRRDTKVHCIYEACATHPKADFTAFEIFKEVKKSFPKTEIAHVVNMFSTWAPAGFIKQTGKKRRAKGSDRKSTVWTLDMKQPQPIILGAKSPQKKAWETRKKTATKKALPPEVDALALGEAIIDYISYLQGRVSELALDLRTVKDKGTTQERALKREIGQLTYQIDGLKKNQSDLQNKLAQSQKRRGLKLDPIIEHHKRTRATG